MGSNAFCCNVRGVLLDFQRTEFCAAEDDTVLCKNTESGSNRFGQGMVYGKSWNCNSPLSGYQCCWADVAFVEPNSGINSDPSRADRH